jgi:hypothetical protein
VPSDEEILRRVLGKIGSPVRFRYPGSEGRKHGILKSRVAMKSDSTSSGVRYWDVIDLIEFPNETKKRWVRFGYYRQDGPILRWAAQTSLAEPEQNMRRLFRTAASRAPWFRRLVGGLERLPNQPLQPTGSPVTPAAGHPARRARRRLS